MNEARLNTVAQLRAFLEGTLAVEFCALADATGRHRFINAVPERLSSARLGRQIRPWCCPIWSAPWGNSASRSRRQRITLPVDNAVGGRGARRGRPDQVLSEPHPGVFSQLEPYRRGSACRDRCPSQRPLGTRTSAPAPARLHPHSLWRGAPAWAIQSVRLAPLQSQRPCRTSSPPRGVNPAPLAGVAIGERRSPAPENRAGFIRVDSLHPGDYDGITGVHPINAVDYMTQFERVARCERSSEAYPTPALQGFDAFPIKILEFPRRQPLRVHPSHGGQAARQAQWGVHQIAPYNPQPQCPGRVEALPPSCATTRATAPSPKPSPASSTVPSGPSSMPM